MRGCRPQQMARARSIILNWKPTKDIIKNFKFMILFNYYGKKRGKRFEIWDLQIM